LCAGAKEKSFRTIKACRFEKIFSLRSREKFSVAPSRCPGVLREMTFLADKVDVVFELN
jgi:hypothetical protein